MGNSSHRLCNGIKILVPILFLGLPLLAQSQIDFLQSIRSEKTYLQSLNDEKDCAIHLGRLNQKLETLNLNKIDFDLAKRQAPEIINELFLTRLEMRESMKRMSISRPVNQLCQDQIRKAFRASRFIEEYVGKMAGLNKDYDVLTGDAPYLLKNPKFPNDFKIQSGDIFISRGNAIVSAAIARIGEEDGQFSHAAIAYVNPQDQKTYMIEAHIEIGTDVAPIEKKYTQDGKVRVVVLRQKNKALAEKAGLIAYNTAIAGVKSGHRIPYDFGMVLNDESNLFCSEIPYMAYKKASAGTFLMGSQYRTTFDLKDNAFLRGIGITEKSTLSPTDIEFDTNLDVVAEWRDFGNTFKTSRKDAVLAKLYQWMETEHFRLDTAPSNVYAHFVTFLRNLPLIGNLLAESLSKDVKPEIIAQMTIMDLVGNAMLDDLIEKYDQFAKDQGRDMTFPEMLQALDEIRIEDEVRVKIYNDWKTSNPISSDSEVSPNQSNFPHFMNYLKK